MVVRTGNDPVTFLSSVVPAGNDPASEGFQVGRERVELSAFRFSDGRSYHN